MSKAGEAKVRTARRPAIEGLRQAILHQTRPVAEDAE